MTYECLTVKKLFWIFIVGLLTFSCSEPTSPVPNRKFNLLFAYGPAARNVLNTFQDTYTKDLILDGTVTIHFVLKDIEFEEIKGKMNEIDFFAYPDTFTVTSDTVAMISRHRLYELMVQRDSTTKSLRWSDNIVTNPPDSAAVKLKSLVTTIIGIIESHPEYSNLPQPRGGYM